MRQRFGKLAEDISWIRTLPLILHYNEVLFLRTGALGWPGKLGMDAVNRAQPGELELSAITAFLGGAYQGSTQLSIHQVPMATAHGKGRADWIGTLWKGAFEVKVLRVAMRFAPGLLMPFMNHSRAFAP